MLRHVDVFLAQSEQDAGRLVEIGAEPARVRLAGNLKFDVKPPGEVPFVAKLRDALHRGGTSHLIVAGSTLAGEEELVLDAFAGVLREYPKASLVLAPRHPERFGRVIELVRRDPRGLRWAERSSLPEGAAIAGGVLVLDSIGELAAVYELATLAFVGGSLVPAGGHNIVEPARFGVPVVVGPHNENFREIVDIFQRANAVRIVDAAALAGCWLELLRDSARRAELGARTAEIARQNAGATARTVEELERLLAPPESRAAAAAPVKAPDSTHVSRGTPS